MTPSLSRLQRALCTAGLLGMAAAGHAATVIGFEEFGNVGLLGPIVTNQYPGVVFSSAGPEANHVTSQAGVGAGLNFLCTGIGTLDCAGETTVTFAGGVSNLSFLAVGSNNTGPQALVDVFVNGSLAATRPIVVSGNFNTPDLVDLTSFSNVTSIRLYAIFDAAGLGWDNFTFGPVSAVPEPQTDVLMLAGLAVVGGFTRRRRS